MANYIERPAIIRDTVLRPSVIRDTIIRPASIRDVIMAREAKVMFEDSAAPTFSFGNALQFNGANMSLNGHVNSQLSGLDKLTINFWCKLEASTSAMTILGASNAGVTQGLLLRLASTSRNLNCYIVNGTGGVYTTNVADGIPLNTKTHIMIKIDLTQAAVADRFYIEKNGTVVTFTPPASVPATIGASGIPTIWGAKSPVANYLDGWLDELAINTNANGYSTYNGGLGREPESANRLVYLKLNESNPATTAVDETGTDNYTVTNCTFTPSIDGFGPLT